MEAKPFASAAADELAAQSVLSQVPSASVTTSGSAAASSPASIDDARIRLPFIVLSTPSESRIDCSVSNDKYAGRTCILI